MYLAEWVDERTCWQAVPRPSTIIRGISQECPVSNMASGHHVMALDKKSLAFLTYVEWKLDWTLLK